MNKNLKRFLTSKVSKRIVSGLTALVLVFGALPLNVIYDELSNLDFTSISVGADGEHTDEDDPEFVHEEGTHTIKIAPNQLAAYSKNAVRYHKYHQYDDLVITAKSGTSSKVFIEGFKGLGTEGKPFSGSISIDSNNSIVLNLDAPLFNYVKDSVTLSNNGNAFEISREYTQNEIDSKEENHIDKTPLLATYVVHDDENPSATWTVGITQPSAGDNPYLGDFGGFIGTMQEGSELIIDVTMDKTAEDTTARNVYGYNRDLGLLCGTMESDSKLTAKLTSNRGVSDIVVDNKSASGHVGGLVGQMRPGSVLDYTGSNVQASSEDIKTSATESYAGGVVGYNDGGTVKMTLPSGTTSYPVTQHIEGTGGAGGVYGYYAPGAIDGDDADINELNSKFDTSKFSINCQVNGEGFDGGVFGVLDCTHNYSFTGTNTITSAHNSGSVDGYGGLIGRYNNEDLSNSLTIGGVTAVSSKTTASYYGGAIAAVSSSDELDGGSCYVKFDGFTASASGADAMTFGGLAAKADNAFIDANKVTIGVSGEHKFQGGAIVGSLESGVLRLTGYTDITNAVANAASYEAGQIVGYRNNALIFAYSGSGNDVWKLKRPNASIQVDDIGSWGEIVRFSAKDTPTTEETKYGFGSDASVVTVNEDEHYAVVSAPIYDDNDSSIISVGSVSDFVKAALNMQLYDDQYEGVLQFESGSDLSSSNLKLEADVDLSGVGISSFTRDNAKTDSTEAEKCVYSGTLDGAGHKLTLAIGEPYGYHGDSEITDHTVEGSGKIYRHRYNGLFGITDSSNEYTAQNVTFKGNIDVNAKTVMYVGALAGQATGTFKIDSVNMVDTISENAHETTFTVDGDTEAYVGGLLGKAAGEIENIYIKDCNIKCNIQTSNTNGDSCFGGVIGWIAYTNNSTRNWSFENVKVSGEINNTHERATNKLGGLIAAIAETTGQSKRALNLTGVTIEGLTVKSVGNDDSTMGGALGYTWLNVNTTFHNVEIKDSTVNMTTGNGALAGLVYQGTGYWKIEPSSVTNQGTTTYFNGIKINGLTVSNSNARSFGGIVHSTISSNSNTALYLEILADTKITEGQTTTITKSYNIASATLDNLNSDCVFDEIAAYTASNDIGANGHAVVSIHSDEFKTDGTSASGTYHAQTARGAVPNPNTRYYYNLDTIRNATGSSDLLMRWALHKYAHSSIQGYFTNGTEFSDNTIPNGTYDMKNYSWYPVDISGSVTVNGSFTFYNKEFEGSEEIKANSETNSYKRTSLKDSTNNKYTQHKYMHASLFRNVTGSLSVGTVTLSGSVGRLENNSGALVCGEVKGSNASTIASISVTGGINLSGVYVNGFENTSTTDLAPLLINSIKGYTNSLIKGVITSNYTADFKAASSLIGDVGAVDASKITLTFKDMKLDGRTTANAYNLNGVYGTTSSIFTRATFLNTFMYSSGSSGVYEFDLDEDWTQNGTGYIRTASQGVTYGSEISDNTTRNQYYGKEFWYKDTQGGTYTNYNQPTASGSGDTTVNFSGFLPYVYDVSTKANVSSEKKYQIKVNHAETKMTGCGTYNDPYIITSGDDLNNIAKILNGDCSNQKIALPNVYDPSSSTNVNEELLKAKKWDDYGHLDYTFDSTNNNFKNSNNKTYTKEQVQTYLAGAYYKIEEGKPIELPSDYLGLGNTETTAAFFRGIIVGKGETITLKGSNPLIHTSYGSVVRNIQVVVDASVTVTGKKADFKEKDGCGAYGAVIGQALGGDNIIDQVSVGFRDNTTITVGGSYANLAAVGGYVGVITYGSLIFRNMSRDAEKASEIQGIPSDSTIVRSSSETNLISDTNMKWLYVNPIVGRVINAAVFTESTKYRPFEEGYREYVGDGGTTTRYNWPDGAVTMKNGTKNYSIADLKKPTAADMSDRLYVSNYSSTTSTANTTYKASVNIPDAQSLFILSLLTQSKMTSTYYAHNNNKTARYCNQAGEGGYAGYYINDKGVDVTGPSGVSFLSSYKTTHLADYNHVGSSDADALADCATAELDTYTPSTKSNPDSLVPYFVKNYTKPQTVKQSEGSYSVFSISNGGTVSYMTWGGTSGSTWYMPDGFRGLGCIFKMDGYINDTTLSVNKLEGNGHVIDLNMSLYHYDVDSDNYKPEKEGGSGFGLFGTLRSNRFGRGQSAGNYDSNNKIKDFTITGSVIYHVYTSSGVEINNVNKSVVSNYYVNVGALVGRLDPASSGNHRSCVLMLENVDLTRMKVEGVYRTGGLIGFVNNGDTSATRANYHHIYIDDCSVDNLNVSSVLYAGGLIGATQNYAIDITNVHIDEPNIVLTVPFASKTKQTDNAVGGIIGYLNSNANNRQTNLKNVTIGEESPQGNYSAYVGYIEPTSYPTNVDFESIIAGGLIGTINTIYSSSDAADYYRTKIEKCNVYNVDIKGHYTGGVVGTVANSNITVGVLDTMVKNTSTYEISGHRVNNATRGTGGIVGFVNGNVKNFVVNNCLVDGYSIKSTQRTGGIIGYTQATKTEIDNTEIKGISLISNSSVGGLVGYLNNPLNGYNIRTDDIEFTPFTSGQKYSTGNITSGNQRGHIIGTNNSAKVVKIVGFSRNNLSTGYDCGSERMVGNYLDTNAARYNSNGYVIFADYEGKSQSSDKSIVASDVNSTANVAVNTYSIESASAQDNNFPYVTTSPKRNIANDQFLTGDAISKLTYDKSVFNTVVNDKTRNVLGAYKNIPDISSDQSKLIESKLSTANSEFSTVASSGMNFPLLVVDDNDSKTVSDMINNYIGVLTNTNGYNFARDESGVYKVSLFRCTYNVGKSKFDVDTSAPNTACLKKFDYGNQKRFRMTPGDVDNGNLTSAQFSLIDVQFFDPSDTEKVAYHLYVPVYVKKLLEFRFDSALLSNTEYYPAVYDKLSGNTVFENLGTPVTMRFEYDYKRDATEWGNAINNGEDVYHNINKVIDVTKHHTQTNVWPSGTKMVLVDANNKDKYYYLNTAPTGSQIDLHSFQNSGVSFTPVPLQDLMTTTIAQSNSGTLTTTTEENATVKYGNNYYRPMTDEEKSETDTTSPNYVAPSNRYTASVSKVNPESYYLTIFTPKNEADTTIYHYELSTVSKLPKVDENDKGWRPNQVDKDYNATVGLYTGNLYSISIAMNVTSKESRLDMDSNNNYLDVTMTSTIMLNGSTEVKRGVASNMLSNADRSSIHQVFLATYDMKPATGSSIVGVQLKAKPNVSVSSYQMYGGTLAQGTGKDIRDGYEITENYIELKNNEDLIDDISLETNGFAVTMATAFRLSYPLADDLSIQFPLNENPETLTGNIGTRVIGYSNISSSAESAPYSSTSKKDDSQTSRYYVTAQTKATLEYNVVESSGNIAGPFSDLGINAQEMDVDDQGNEKIKTKSLIHTQAKYDTSKLKERGDYIEMTLKISKKSDYDTALKLSDYVENIKITGLNGTPLFNQATDPDGTVKYDSENKVVIKVTREDNAYKIRVRKDQIQTIGNASDGVYYVPIEFEAFTGDAKFNSQSHTYSNYRMTLEMKMYQTDDAVENQYLIPTKATDYVVYTNAKVFPDVVH